MCYSFDLLIEFVISLLILMNLSIKTMSEWFGVWWCDIVSIKKNAHDLTLPYITTVLIVVACPYQMVNWLMTAFHAFVK